MRNNARIQAAIEVLDAIDATDRPADRVLDRYLKDRRYIGGGDRGTISARVWGVLRRRSRIDWVIKTYARKLGRTGRGRVVVDLMLVDGFNATRIGEFFDGSKYAPLGLSKDENEALRFLEGRTLEDPDMPDPVRYECPPVLWDRMVEVFGDRVGPALAALGETAPFDMRINPLSDIDRTQAIAKLAELNIPAVASPLSPLGLRFDRRRPVDPLELFRSGAIEVQDEGSQIAALLADARPGMTVVDYCAGAGGKSLVLAGRMRNKGRLLVLDTSEPRLKRAVVRFRRAGVQNAERRVLVEGDKTVKRLAGKAQRVLVDAPCTGTGTWRRNPDAKLRYGPDEIAEITALQGRILDKASRIVAPGGRLIYVTCSVLREENETAVETFMAAHDDFTIVPIGEVWAETVAAQGGAATCPAEGDFLRLSPDLHDTDGFFVAVLERAPAPAATGAANGPDNGAAAESTPEGEPAD
jgi:16S rRNA (cytosine967-C5)-methyltransferase